jgi:hypothetical protein
MAIDITAYIKELLFGHDCVIIPGFGAFIGNYSAARIDREEGLFYPPVKKITFNRHLITNDGLLIGHISARTGLSYGEARDLIVAFTEDLRGKVTAGSKVMISQLGTFSTNREGTFIFEPDSTANYLLSSYGLESYHRQPVNDFDVRKKVLERHEKPAQPQPSMRRLLTRAAVIIPLLVAMALVPFHKSIFREKVSESNLNPLATAELEYNRSQITNVTPAQPAESTTVGVTGPVQVSQEPAVIVEEGGKFMLITGSFKSEENALIMVGKLRNKGYDPEISAGPDGFLRVSALTSETLPEAESILGKLKKDYPGTWICKSR